MKLLRVEHFDKGVPFESSRWQRPKTVPAITGAVMAFRRSAFEKLGGFSTAQQSMERTSSWQHRGQGSRARGEQYRGAAIVNRHVFSLQHGNSFEQRAVARGGAVMLDIPDRSDLVDG